MRVFQHAMARPIASPDMRRGPSRDRGTTEMKLIPIVLAAVGALAATQASTQYASAQYLDLSGRYRCVQLCRDGGPQPAFITQAGRELNLVNEAGEPARAWIDWIGHIWADTWQQGAIYSPDG